MRPFVFGGKFGDVVSLVVVLRSKLSSCCGFIATKITSRRVGEILGLLAKWEIEELCCDRILTFDVLIWQTMSLHVEKA